MLAYIAINMYYVKGSSLIIIEMLLKNKADRVTLFSAISLKKLF